MLEQVRHLLGVRRVAADEDDFDPRLDLRHRPVGVDGAEFGHDDIHHHEIDVPGLLAEDLDRLFAVSGLRIRQLRDRRCAADQYLVPGTRALLEDLRARGLRLYLASGTDDAHLKEEAGLLDITRYFDGGIYGALPDPDAFSKRMLMERILRLPGMRPHHLIGFGDGPVEIEEVKRAGGVAVGLATDEPECRDTSPWKRRNLIEVGANYIIPNYLCRQVLLPMLFANHEPI